MKKKSGSDPTNKMSITVGSGCGSVGRAVASDTRDPRFQSSHQQNFYRTFVYCQLCWKDEKRPGMAHFLNANHKIVESIWLVEKSLDIQLHWLKKLSADFLYSQLQLSENTGRGLKHLRPGF